MRGTTESFRKRILSSDALQLFVVVSLATGLLAHVLLDGVANVVLAHDPYDDVVHGSRFPLLLIVALATLAGALRALWRLVVDATAPTHRAERPVLADVPFPLLAVAVAFAGSIVLISIEASDALVARGALPSVVDLCAGSLPLAFAIVCAAATLSCVCARLAGRKIASLRPSIVRAIACFFAVIARCRACVAARCKAFRDDTLPLRNPLSVRAGKRAPPPPAIG